MQCPCGGSTEFREAKKGVYTLEYQACTVKRCGRVGGERLFLCGSVIKMGLAARRAFQDLDKKEQPDGVHKEP